jgi:hypothetical protein
MADFEQNAARDASLVYAGMHGGFPAVASQAMFMPEFKGGPDRVLAHAEWLKAQPATYIKKVTDLVVELENNYRAGGAR